VNAQVENYAHSSLVVGNWQNAPQVPLHDALDERCGVVMLFIAATVQASHLPEC
jgi:hypothetical protein